MSKEYIEKEAVIEALGEEPLGWAGTDAELQAMLDWEQFKAMIESITAAYVKPVVKGKWEGDKYFEICSVCGSEPAYFVGGWEWEVEKMPNFCPNCGADMRKEANDE